MDIADLFNYADDNSVACYDVDYEGVSKRFLKVSCVMLKWFKDNYMQANPYKFQFILVGSDYVDKGISVNYIFINAAVSVKLLGCTFTVH
jgi:hypothetical protein